MMSVKFDWHIISTLKQPISKSVIIYVNDIKQTLTKYELEHAFPATESAKWLIPQLLSDQINNDTGISYDLFTVSRWWFNKDNYVVKFYNLEAYTLFKLVYGRMCIQDNKS